MTRGRLIPIVAAVAVVAGCGKPKQATDTQGSEAGQVAPDIAGVDLDGHSFKLGDHRGKVVMLDFWRTA
jgi:hypothetical protein